MIDLNAIITRNPNWKVNALGGQDQQDIRAMISELLFYVRKCTKCENHLGLLAESACPYCRLTTEVTRLTSEIELEREDCERLRAANGELWKQQCEASEDVDRYQQREDEVIVALGSRGILPSEIVAEVKRLRAGLEWIPWSEDDERPRPHTDVLILYEYDSIHGHRGVHITEDSRMNTGKWESESDVTHWMPLPDLPDSASSSQEPSDG